MAESLTIDRNNKLPNALDYNFLRKEGISLIEKLSGKIWTDYNTHDPGITLLEAMCYALTDLGYRSAFTIEDLLTPSNKSSGDTWKNLFFTAREALPCNPLTLVDYRKLIIDTEGVRNAWIEISDEYEILIYLQKTQKNPQTKQSYNLTYDYKKGEDVLHLRGLYKVFVEYEDEVLEENRENNVAKIIWQKLQFHRNLTEDFISVTSVEYENFPVEAVIQVSEGTDIEMINARIYKLIHDFFSPPVNFYSLEEMIERGLSPEEIFEGPILNYGFIDAAELLKSDRFKNIHLSDIINLISGIEGVIAVKKFTFQVDSVSRFSNFTEWINNVKDKQKTPKLDIKNSNIIFERSGDRHRTDSEKQVNKERVNAIFAFLASDNLKTRLRGSGKDLPLPSGEFMDVADYYPFQKNLPAVYGMMDSLIDNNERIDRVAIEKALHELLVEKAGVNGARLINLLRKFKKDNDKIEKLAGNLVAGPEENAASVRDILDMVLEEEKTDKVLNSILHEIFGNDPGLPSDRYLLYEFVETDPDYRVPSNKTMVIQELAAKKMNQPLQQVNSSGEIAKLDALYKIRQVDMLDRRKKLVLQLRGFLMVFEQILADYLSQLSHVREIFSFDENIKQTFYPQVIVDIQDMEALFIDFLQYKEFHLKMIETTGAFETRRNHILSHILARYSESMDKYAFFMQQFEGKEAAKRLISDKVDFLSDYVQASSYRGKGYNYADPDDHWNSNNVEGIKKRICRLLGIKHYSRKKIAPAAFSIQKKVLEPEVERYIVTLADPGNPANVLLTSMEFKFESEAIIILTYILEQGNNLHLYTKEGHGNRWYFELNRLTPENKYEPVAFSKHYPGSNERDEALEKTLNVLNGFSDDENFHILEHILLRPKIGPAEKGASFDDVVLLPVEYVPDKISSAETQKKDVAYKFKIVHTPDPNKTRNIWKLSLMKNNTEFLVVSDDFIFTNI